MFKLRPFQRYFTALYVLGLNPFISFTAPNKKRSKFISIFFRSLNILVSLFVVYITGVKLQFNKSFIVFGHLTFISDVSINFIAVFENLSNLNATYRILQTLSFVIGMFGTTFKSDFPYKAMKKSIIWKFSVIFVTVFLKFMGHYGYAKGRLVQNLSWGIYDALTGVHLMHLIFYIEFIKFILAGVSEKVVVLTTQKSIYWRCEKTSDWLHVMHRIKLIYFKLWRIAHSANTLFGWFLLSFMMEQATKFIYYSYFTFIYATETHNGVLFILRKYFFRNWFSCHHHHDEAVGRTSSKLQIVYIFGNLVFVLTTWQI